MKCYACNNVAKFSCSCTIPSILICDKDLNTHLKDNTLKHVFILHDQIIEISLFTSTMGKLNKIRDQIINEIKEKIIEISKEAK